MHSCGAVVCFVHVHKMWDHLDITNSVPNVFLDCTVLLCDFHREQAWERWLTTTSNGVRSRKGEILAFIRRIADCETEEKFDSSVDDLKSSEIWQAEQSGKFRNWFDKTWLTSYKVSDIPMLDIFNRT